MKEVLAYYKETERKYRWDAECNGVLFEFYIPQWRVPVPIPKRIIIQIFTESEFRNQITLVTCAQIKSNPSLAANPITAKVVYNEEHTKTVRYDPELREAEIGSPYIPLMLLEYPYPQSLVITVDWN